MNNSSSNLELARLRFDYEEQLARYQVKDRIVKRLSEEKIREIDLRAQARLTDLKDTEKAMLNILEDAQILKEQLKEQKAGVEQEVKERTRELKEEQARLAASIKGLPLGFIMMDNQNNIVMVNPAIEKIFSKGDITMDWLAGQLGDKFDFLENCRKCREEKKITDIKDIEYGSKFLRFFLAPIVMINDHEEVVGAVVLIEDITEAKVIERSREEFFAVASHELRTPLTAIRGNSEMIQDIYKDKIIDKDMAGMISDITEASVRLIGIVNDFLDISRLEQGKVVFKKEPVDLLSVIKDACVDLGPLAKTKSLSCALVEPKSAPPLVFADKARIKEVISNLIDNAVKYTSKGGITITVEQGDKSVVVFVRDTGNGISLKNQALLFRKFQQAGEEMLTRDVSKSTGLGLYISKLLMEGMGGTIGLTKSVLGEGSTFQFTIPIVS